MPGSTLNDRHLDALREVVEASEMTTPGVALPWEVLESLSRLLGCDEVVFIGIDDGAQSHYFCQDSRDGHNVYATTSDAAACALFWQDFQSSTHRPPRIPERLHSVTKPTDFITEKEWRNLPLDVDWFREGPKTSHELMMCSPDGAGRQLRLLCWRHPGQDFTERDRFDLQLLMPHIQAAYRRGERQRLAPEITVRQRELLQWVGGGYTNQQIGRRMGLAEGTVRSHLNNIYSRLGVRSRTEAVTRVLTSQELSRAGSTLRERSRTS